MPADTLVDEYLLLGLRLGRLVDGFVDCWFGDPALAAQVAAEPQPNPAELAVQASALLERLPDSDLAPDRQRFITAQLTGLQCSARRLAGEPMQFHAEVQAYFEVSIELGDTDRYAAIHDEIAELLPGSGDLAGKLAEFHARDRVPAEHLGRATQAISDELRTLTRARFGLPAGEVIDYEVVGDRPWNAFNRYLGGFRSRVTLNADVGHGMSALPLLATHECYPGHHTEHCLKETHLVHERGHREQVVSLVNTPQCLMAEGMAEVALPAVLGPGWGTWTADILAGLDLHMDGELVEQLLPLTTRLLAARQDAAILLHDLGADADDVVAYLRRWMLVGEDRAKHMVRFLTDPLWRAYTVTYIEGSRLVREWVAARPEGQHVSERYHQLLLEPMLPSMLREQLQQASRTS